MHLLVYLLFYPLLKLISLMPFPMLYAFSDGVYILIYRIIGYRKRVVRSNLKLALPHLSETERKVIEKKFYRHLCDMFLEMIKTLSITRKEIDERFTYSNLEVYQNLEKKGKSIAFMIAHYASYEWVISMNHQITFDGYAIYKKIANPHFDNLVKKIRSNFKAHLITTKETIPTIEENYRTGKLSVYGFASDQSPKGNKAYHWGSFMGVEVPMHTGAEMLAKRFDMNIIYLKVKKVKRGYYQGTFEVLSEDVKSIPDYQITDEFTRRVEKQILESPEFYLWTHKRWKHSRSS
ncbi:MAG: lysophospholipid acyltransferase family protein [Flavobacterium sp.]